MTHCIEWSMKMKIKNEIWNFQSWKVEVGKSKKILSQKMFEKIQSAQMDHRVSISSSSAFIRWPIALNDQSQKNVKKSKNQVSQKMFEKN